MKHIENDLTYLFILWVK